MAVAAPAAGRLLRPPQRAAWQRLRRPCPGPAPARGPCRRDRCRAAARGSGRRSWPRRPAPGWAGGRAPAPAPGSAAGTAPGAGGPRAGGGIQRQRPPVLPRPAAAVGAAGAPALKLHLAQQLLEGTLHCKPGAAGSLRSFNLADFAHRPQYRLLLDSLQLDQIVGFPDYYYQAQAPMVTRSAASNAIKSNIKLTEIMMEPSININRRLMPSLISNREVTDKLEVPPGSEGLPQAGETGRQDMTLSKDQVQHWGWSNPCTATGCSQLVRKDLCRKGRRSS
uniref:Uncharacterized protein n=1 Tax=Strix occidentalis caurina TaxID=311401 RepID=A0A8D0FEW8_STROC